MRGSTAGFSGTFATKSQTDSALLQCADVFFASVVITPATVVYWKSAWTLMDLYIFPEDHIMSSIVTAVFGFLCSIILCLFQSHLSKYINPDRGRVKYYVFSRLYSCVAGITCIAAVRGVWDLMNACSGDGLTSVLWSTAASILLLAALRTLKNICAIPFVVVIDSPRDHFDVPTFFRKTAGAGEMLQYVLDCVFSVVVVGSLVIGVWRGLWTLADMLIYPNNFIMSCCVSLILGYGLVIATFALQEPIRWVAMKLNGAARLLLADVYNLVSFIATVSVWRGIWDLMDEFFFPGTPEITNWCSHIVSLLVLVVLNCFNTVLVRGVYFDDEEPADEAVIFPCHYIRIHYYKRKMRKKYKQATDAEINTLANSNVPLQFEVCGEK